MNADSEGLAYANHLRVEHLHIDREVQKLTELLHRVSQSPDGLHEMPAFLIGLSSLREVLRRHFHSEETGGCMEEAKSRAPSLSASVDILLAQHSPFLVALDTIIEEAGMQPMTAAVISDLQRRFKQLATNLHEHEAEENRILLSGFGSQAMDSMTS